MTELQCSAVKLTSREGRPFWFRTCDIGDDVWAAGAHPVSFPRGIHVPLADRAAPFRFDHAVAGVTYNQLDTWLLDGVNDAGLCGGLLALYESTSVPAPDPGLEGVMGMEMVTYLLGRCATVADVAREAGRVQVLDVPMGAGRTVTSAMHCMFTDAAGRCLILEAADPKKPGRFTPYEENLGLMTNSPPYPQQLENLAWYLYMSPEARFGLKGETIDAITLNGLTVKADKFARHLPCSWAFPGSYAARDRFIRAAMLVWLNDEGRTIPDEQMLPLGSNLMSAVFEPPNRGLYHYTHLNLKGEPVGRHESFTQYLVMYDLTARTLYLKPYDSTAWTRLALVGCPDDRVACYRVNHAPLGGVVDPF